MNHRKKITEVVGWKYRTIELIGIAEGLVIIALCELVGAGDMD